MPALKRQLSARHISMIALGGSLGTGIFLTSGSSLFIGGPGGALIAYALMGLVVYLMMNSLGEMAAYQPVAGSFCQYATDYVSPSFGFAMGYNYWFNWAVTIAVELVAASIIMAFWFPHVNPIIWCGIFFTVILVINLLPVRHYGETEYWLSLIKVAAIVLFILIGIIVIFGLNDHLHAPNWHNWVMGDAPFHGGFSSLLEVFLLSGFAFQGTELVGITAGEAKDPARTIPRAIKQVFWRILLFYILTMLVISFIIPYTDKDLLNPGGSVALSPFTLILSHAGFHYAATVMNVVILCALLSACNSDMYSATRILWHLGESGSAPRCFAKVNRFGIPIYALLATASFGLLAFLCSYVGSTKIFLWLVSLSSLSGFIAWVGIALSHYCFRKQFLRQGNDQRQLPFLAPFYPWAPLLVLVLCLVVIVGQGYLLLLHGEFSWTSLLATYIGVPLVLLLWLGSKIYFARTK